MLAELIQLLIPAVILVWVYFLTLNSFRHYDRFYENLFPVIVLLSLMYFVVILYATLDKYGVIQKPVEYSCPVGKVVFYNFGNVICIDGEKAKEIVK